MASQNKSSFNVYDTCSSRSENLEAVSDVLRQTLALSSQLRGMGIFLVATPMAIESIKDQSVGGSKQIAENLEINARNLQTRLKTEANAGVSYPVDVNGCRTFYENGTGANNIFKIHATDEDAILKLHARQKSPLGQMFLEKMFMRLDDPVPSVRSRISSFFSRSRAPAINQKRLNK